MLLFICKVYIILSYTDTQKHKNKRCLYVVLCTLYTDLLGSLYFIDGYFG